MKNDRVVTINGKSYRVAQSSPINNHPSNTPYSTGKSMDFSRPSRINHFTNRKPIASTIQVVKNSVPQVRKIASDIASPVRHPMTQRADMIRAQVVANQQQKTAPKTTEQIKNEAIDEALSKPIPKPKKISFLKRHKKLINAFSISLLIILVAGYLLYVNIPNFSVYIASAQAGIDATYPEYKPDGYALDGPVTYDNGQVMINFKSTTNRTKFVIKQVKSSWDSSAVKNMVTKNADGDTIITTEERGLTIFAYNGNAAWVNGGILYTITGNATLSNDQVRRIATSL